MKYDVELGAVASNFFSGIEAGDPDEAIEIAFGHPNYDLSAKVGDKYDFGDPVVLGVWDEDGNEVVKSELCG